MIKPPFHILSDDELSYLSDTLRKQAKIRDLALIQLCAATGLRNAEACALNNHHFIKFGAVVKVLDIDEHLAFAVPRQIPLSQNVREVVEIYWQWKEEHCYPLAPNAPFFCTLYTKKRLVPLDFHRIVKNASKILGFSLTPHALRHTFAAKLYHVTGELRVVQYALGLRSVEAVRIYQKCVQGSALSESLFQAIEASNSVFAPFSGSGAGEILLRKK
jgi:integrase/recombinase XerD